MTDHTRAPCWNRRLKRWKHSRINSGHKNRSTPSIAELAKPSAPAWRRAD